jgi:FO synthase subunit 2
MISKASSWNITTSTVRDVLRKTPKQVNHSDLSLLLKLEDPDLVAEVVQAADILRREQVGDAVSFVINRNINFTNACVKRCGFCAFSRTPKGLQKSQSYFLPLEEIANRAVEARRLGATEICVQAGLPPGARGDLYLRVAERIKRVVPDIHLHAFSPEEVLYGAHLSGVETSVYLKMLRAAGVDSLPGTAAEILVQHVRDKISPGRISVQEWLRIAKEAHDSAGMRMTATMMFGHVETAEDIAEHLLTIRSLQQETQVFTEFVPLSFVHWEAPMRQKKDTRYLPECRDGPSSQERLLVHAVTRIALGDSIRNIQCSWPKESPQGSSLLLQAGCNDLGGTLMNESISTAAGAKYGQLMTPGQMHRIVMEAGPERYIVQRDTVYNIIGQGAENDLNEFANEKAESKFGSFQSMLQSSSFRFHKTIHSFDSERKSAE